MGHRLGLGIRHDLPLPGVVQGLLPTRSWKLENRGRPWLEGDTLNAGIGQGFVLASSVQIAVMTARLATGLAVEPRLIRSMGASIQRAVSPPSLGIIDSSLDLMRRGMFAAVNNRAGTAYEARSVSEDCVIAGKTGTSQIRSISLEERRRGLIKNEDLPWNRRDHALFCGYAPYSNPRYAVAVIVEHGGGGSTVAAPIARDLLLRAHFGRLPPLEAYPEADRPRIKLEQEELEFGPSDPAAAASTRA